MNRRLVSPFLVAALCLFSSSVFSAETVQTLRFRDDVKKNFIEAPGIATDIRIDVEGTIARTTVTQYFLNDTEIWQEGVYRFPLPDDAAVDSLTMMVGDRRVIGFVAEKAEAKKIYETAKAEGQAAGLVDQHRPNLFKTSVANIPPQSLIAIEIQYQAAVRLDEQRFSLKVPLAITPRYQRMDGEQLRQLVTSAGQAWAEEVVDRLALSDVKGGNNPVDLNVTLRAGFPVQSLESGAHAIETEKFGDGVDEHYRITLENGVTPGNRDFTLTWTAMPSAEPYQAFYSEQREDGYYSHLLIMPPTPDPERDQPVQQLKRQVTFVIDVSGSMDGPSLRQAKKALLLALDDLGQEDFFNIIAFSDTFWRLFPRSTKADRQQVDAARAAVDGLVAGGGTEMMPVLLEALTEPEAADHLRQIVFITDGAIGYEDQVAATIKKLIGKARFFAIGIGAAPNAHLMRHVAMAGRGSYTFIDDVNEVEHELSSVFQKMKAPALTDLELVLPAGVEAEILPEKLPDLLAGEPISIAIKSAEPLTKLSIEGQRGDQIWEQTMTVDRSRSAEGIGKIFARRKIRSLTFDGLGMNDPKLQAAITDIAIQHQLISDHTSLVAVDEAVLRLTEEPIFQKNYDPTLPLGWQEDRLKALEAEAAYRRLLQQPPSKEAAEEPLNQLIQPISLPQTAIGYRLYLLIGVALMMAAFALLMVQGRARHA